MGALEVEKLLRRYQSDGNTAKISQVIQYLAREFANSVSSHCRKGGLIALAGVAIGLMEATKVRTPDEHHLGDLWNTMNE